jgi:iron(III) transport system substrate-binding protein
MMFTKLARAALLLAVTLGIGNAHAQEKDWNAVIAAAKKEGRVAVYNAQLGPPYFLQVIKAFEDKYGIKVDRLDVRASELTERVRAEQTAGHYVADLEMHSAITIEQQLRDNDFIVPHGGVPNLKNLRPPFTATPTHIPAFVQAYGILVNTKLVAPQDMPTRWSDLLDPKWKGKILSDDVRAIGTGNTVFFVLNKLYGTQYFEKLAANKPVFSRELRNDERRVARGEYPIYLTEMYAFATTLQGLPVKVVVPADGSPYTPIDFAMLKNGPHPNAARLFINHFLEVESQLTYANAQMVPVVNGVLEKTNADARAVASTKLLGTTVLDERPAGIELAKKLFP